MEKIKVWILTWFEQNSAILNIDISEDKNYVENGWIDSFQFLDLISAAEDEFGISFNDDDFAKEELLTIKGMIEIIAGKL